MTADSSLSAELAVWRLNRRLLVLSGNELIVKLARTN